MLWLLLLVTNKREKTISLPFTVDGIHDFIPVYNSYLHFICTYLYLYMYMTQVVQKL